MGVEFWNRIRGAVIMRRPPARESGQEVKRSTDRILTTHAGSLPRPLGLRDAIRSLLDDQPYDEAELAGLVRSAVTEAVRQQADAGVDIISDGEQGKTGFLLYGNQRLAGFELAPARSPTPAISWSNRTSRISVRPWR